MTSGDGWLKPALRARCIVALTCITVVAGCAPGGDDAAADAPDIRNAPWPAIVAAARGSEVNLFMWGGDQGYNDYIDRYAAPALERGHGITLRRTPLSDTEDLVNRLLDEKRAGRTRGSADLLWINGHGFATGAQAGLWFGPWAERLPNARFIDWTDPAINRDFGYPVAGREAPWSRAQLVMICDAARVAEPPSSLPALLDWARANPGRFTYPAPPDFTGTAFIEQALILLTGREYQEPFDPAVFEAQAPRLWRYLNDLEPSLWRAGETYPASSQKLNELFSQGEIFITMSYNPQFAARQVANGIFPATARSFIFDAGSLRNTSYLAMPFNAPNKPGAAVVADFLESPEAQIRKQDPAVLGALTVLAPDRLRAAEHDALTQHGADAASVPLAVLDRHGIPEANSEWVVPLQQGWRKHVSRE